MLIGLLSACTMGFGESLVSNRKGPRICVSLNNQPCQAGLTLVNINSDETHFYPLNVSVNKSGESCNTIDYPFGWLFVKNKVKILNLIVSNLMSGVNEARFLVQQELCELVLV